MGRSVGVRGSEGGPARAPLASKLSVALHMGQTSGPAFLLFKWVASLAYLSLSSIISPLLEYPRGILTDLALLINSRRLCSSYCYLAGAVSGGEAQAPPLIRNLLGS